MLKEKYYTSEGSIYICDLCGKVIKLKDTNKYTRKKDKTTNKAFDLCDKCDRKLNKSIMNYAKKHKKEE